MQEMKTKRITVKAYSITNKGIKDTLDQWYNIAPDMSELAKADFKEKEQHIKQGAELELMLNQEGNFIGIKILKETAKITDESEAQVFKNVLKKAHEKFGEKLSIETTNLEKIDDGWLACASVNIGDQTFTAHGEATIDNSGTFMKQCLPRFAETRAMGRALRLSLGDWGIEEKE